MTTAIIPATKLDKVKFRSNPFHMLSNLAMGCWAQMDTTNMTVPWSGLRLKMVDSTCYVTDLSNSKLIMKVTPEESTLYLSHPTVTSVRVDGIDVDYSAIVSPSSNSDLYLVNRALAAIGEPFRITEGEGILRCKVLEKTVSYNTWEPFAYMDNELKFTYTPPVLMPEGTYDWSLQKVDISTDLVDDAGEAGVRYRKLDMKVVRKAREDFNASMAGFHTMYTMGIFKGAWPTKAEWITASKLNFDGIVAREPFWWMKLISMAPSSHVYPTEDGTRMFIGQYWRREEYKFDSSPQQYIDRLWRDNKEMVYERVGAERPEVTSIEEYDNRGKKTE